MRHELARPAVGAAWLAPVPLPEGTRLLLRCVAPSSSADPQLCAVDPLNGGTVLISTVATLGAALPFDSVTVVRGTTSSPTRIYFSGVLTASGAHVRYMIRLGT